MRSPGVGDGMSDLGDIDELRKELRRRLDSVAAWLASEPSLSTSGVAPGEAANEVIDREWLAAAQHTIKQLKIRAASSLINVAFVGGYSSGKSFLISGLQNRLEYEPVAGDDPDEIASARYIGLLFSAPQATTACPATIVPVDGGDEYDASGRGFLRVLFSDGPDWENVGNSPAPAVVASYTTQNDEIIINRLSADHRERTVAEVEILLDGSTLPAKLYDLPGTGSLEPIHDEISNRAWADADCIVFTTQATASLGMADDELISRLYSHYLGTAKKIIWVVTGIDRSNVARNLSDNKVGWKEAIDADNAYLRSRYPMAYGQPSTLLGPTGFIGVSPAWEAYGKWLIAQGQAAEGRKYIGASRMSELRRVLTDLVEAGTGRRHIFLIAREARNLLSTRLILLREVLETAKTPLDALAGERDSLRARLQALQASIPLLHDELDGIKKAQLREFRVGFRGLADHLHAELDGKIKAADLTKEREAAQIDRRKAEIFKEWTASQGPQESWDQGQRKFLAIVATKLQVIMGETKPADGFATSQRINIDQLRIPPSARYRTGAPDILGQVSAVVGISAPVLGGIAAAAGIISGPFIAIPVGITVAAGLIYGVVRWVKGNTDALDLLRQAWVESLNEQAKRYEALATVSYAASLTAIIDRATELLAEREIELSRKIILTEASLTAPDKARLSEIVTRLQPFCERGAKLDEQLKALINTGF
jgi:hypothetical protein